MGKQFDIIEPYYRVIMPNGISYDAGDTVVLSDADYALITPGMARTFVEGDVTVVADPVDPDDEGTAGEVILTAPDDSRWRIIVGNDGALDTEEVIADEAPVNTVAPAITGTPETGETVTCSTGTWTGVPTPTYARQWQRDNVDISGETAATYDLVVEDEGTDITCVVTATNTVGSVTAESDPITPTAPAADYASLVVADGAIAYWRLEDLTEEIGGFDLTNDGGGATATLGATGLITDVTNGALAVDNSGNASLSVADAAGLRVAQGSFSVEMWVNPGFVAGFGLVSKDGDFGLDIFSGVYRFTPIGAGDWYAFISSDTAAVVGETRHLVCTWDFATKTIAIIVDGVEEATVDASGFGFTVSASGWGALRIGKNTDTLSGNALGGTALAPGTIDEVALYDFAMDETMAAAHFAAGTA